MIPGTVIFDLLAEAEGTTGGIDGDVTLATATAGLAVERPVVFGFDIALVIVAGMGGAFFRRGRGSAVGVEGAFGADPVRVFFPVFFSVCILRL